MKRSTTLARRAFPWRMLAPATCTGISALWCPVHGSCTCPRADDGDFPHGLNDDGCQLHSRRSTHPRSLAVTRAESHHPDEGQVT